MTIKTTRWSPDTCGCVLEYTWDDTQPESTRTHTLSTFVTRCSAHSGLANDTARWNTIFEENPRKNIALQVALDNGPTTLYDMSGTNRIIKPTVIYDYVWSGTAPNRTLTISFPNVALTNTQKTTIRNAINTRLGSGKVTLL